MTMSNIAMHLSRPLKVFYWTYRLLMARLMASVSRIQLLWAVTGYSEIVDFDSPSLYSEDGVSAFAVYPRVGRRTYRPSGVCLHHNQDKHHTRATHKPAAGCKS